MLRSVEFDTSDTAIDDAGQNLKEVLVEMHDDQNRNVQQYFSRNRCVERGCQTEVEEQEDMMVSKKKMI